MNQFQNYLPQNKYMKHYLLLVQKRQTEVLDKESNHVHHVLPKSVFPEYRTEKWNLVTLTPREHFIAHLLLWRGTEWKEMQQAMWLMNNDSSTHGNKRLTGRQYQILQEQIRPIYSEYMSKCMKGKVLCLDHFGEKHWVDVDDPRIKTGELFSYQIMNPVSTVGRYVVIPPKETIIKQGLKSVYDANGNFMMVNLNDYDPSKHTFINNGKTNIILPNGRRMKISTDVYDPKIHKHVNAGKMNAVDVETGKIIQADVNDPRFKTGEIKQYRSEYVGSEKHRNMLIERNKISRTWIKHPDGRSITVLPEEVEQYLADGWSRGRHYSASAEGKANMCKQLSQRKWINNGKDSKMINESELEKYLSDGWRAGRIIPSRKTSLKTNIDNTAIDLFSI